MSGADAVFLYAERGGVHGHSVAMLVLDPGGDPVEQLAVRIRALLKRRVSLVPALRQAVSAAPFGAVHPLRYDDATLDVDQHFRHEVFLDPASDSDLAGFVGRFASTRLDRTRPLWEMILVEGAADGTVALLAKLHHSIADGDEAVGILMTLLDLDPDGQPGSEPAADGQPSAAPTGVRVLATAAVDALLHPARPAKAGLGVARSLTALVTGPAWAGRGADDARGLAARPSAFNGELTARRSVAVAQVPLSHLRRARLGAGGATVNDVLLAAVSGGLRRYLGERGASVDRSLVASVPVRVQRDDGTAGVNQLSAMTIQLPVDALTAIDRLRAVRRRTASAKRYRRFAGRGLVPAFSDAVPAPVLRHTVQMAQRAPSAVAGTSHNLVVSNLIGPPLPLWLGGAKLVACYPFGPLPPGCALGVNAMSSNGSLDLGVMVCPDVVPEPEAIVEAIVGEVKRLSGTVQALRRGEAFTSRPGRRVSASDPSSAPVPLERPVPATAPRPASPSHLSTVTAETLVDVTARLDLAADEVPDDATTGGDESATVVDLTGARAAAADRDVAG